MNLKYWFKLISITGLAQAAVQAVGFVSGILVIRLLPVDEYALYTLANTMLGTMTMLSDGGISTGVMAQGGKVWQDRHKLGAVLATGLDLRRKFAGFSLVVSIPILLYLLLHHGATWVTAILITASLIPAFYAALSDGLLQIPVKLHQAIPPLQRNQVEVSIGRLVLTALSLFAFPWAFVAILASGLPRIWGNVRLRKIADGFVEKDTGVDREVRKGILNGMKRLMPDAIYYSLSGQLTVWLISIFGKTSAIASIGALGRISAVLSIFTMLLSTVVIPRFAKYEANNVTLTKKVSSTSAIVVAVLLAFVLLSSLFSDFILNILGKNYQNLNYALVLSVIIGCIGVLIGLGFGIVNALGWPTNPLWVIIGNIVFIVSGLYFFDISTLVGVLYFGIFTSISLVIVHSLNLVIRLIKC